MFEAIASVNRSSQKVAWVVLGVVVAQGLVELALVDDPPFAGPSSNGTMVFGELLALRWDSVVTPCGLRVDKCWGE